jgi:hypothetical protein
MSLYQLRTTIEINPSNERRIRARIMADKEIFTGRQTAGPTCVYLVVS